MIKVNLLPVKKKRRAKPVPGFLVAAVVLPIATAAVLVYVIYSMNAALTSRKDLVAKNDKKIAQLKEKIKSVTDYEKRNAEYKKRKELVEKLSRNRTLPVKALDEISSLLPAGVWLNSLKLSGDNISLSGTAFTNTDVVNYVNNCKNSRMFTNVYLGESVQTSISGFSAYNFRLTFKVKS
ncbi:MAG: PilN domain-containing protein [Candidatus Sulfobium sp.]|jgi:type IV pilus assembly protein PilN